jgi:predicted GNAT family N-acyltransferase
MNEEVVELEYGGTGYHRALELRHAVLRKPLGLDLFKEPISGEAENRHFGIERDGELLACLMCVPIGTGSIQIRQMAVREDRQGSGLGRRLMEAVEVRLRAEGTRLLVLNARVPAVGFYEKLGYQPIGERFIEVGIPHQRMEKPLG